MVITFRIAIPPGTISRSLVAKTFNISEDFIKGNWNYHLFYCEMDSKQESHHESFWQESKDIIQSCFTKKKRIRGIIKKLRKFVKKWRAMIVYTDTWDSLILSHSIKFQAHWFQQQMLTTVCGLWIFSPSGILKILCTWHLLINFYLRKSSSKLSKWSDMGNWHWWYSWECQSKTKFKTSCLHQNFVASHCEEYMGCQGSRTEVEW